MRGGETAVADYELLELILFRAIPRRDVKPLAKELIARFGGAAEVLGAEPARLREIKGLGEAAITEFRIVAAAAVKLAEGRATERPVVSSWQEMMRYCKARMAWGDVEQFRLLFLDRKNRIIADEQHQRGTVDQVPVYPREVVRRALELNASAVILAHNHPSGDPTPSRADIEMTKLIVTACSAVNIKVHDHVIIGRELDASFRALGLL